MQFNREASVLTSDFHNVGRVDRVVLNPQTKEVTHIVVRRGFLFTEDKLVPLSLIASGDENRVLLRPDAGDLNALPVFEETHFIPLDKEEANAAAYPPEMAIPLYWYGPMGGWMSTAELPAYRTEVEQNIPDDTIAVKEGASVISSDGKNVGHVDRVFADATTDRATYFVISHGMIFKAKKSIPMSWVRTVTEDEVRLNVGASVLDNLREYQEA
jgi:uncharacterized protein YrrD